MSLILEALKKSEAERQRGQAPGLFVEQAPLARARREGAPAWAYALGALLLVVLAVFGWREWSRGESAAPSPQPSPASGRGSEAAAPPPAGRGGEAAVLQPAGEGGEAAVLPLPSVGEGRGEGAVVRAGPPAPAPMPSPQPSPASGRGSEAAVLQPAGEGGEAAVLQPAGPGREAGSIPRLADLAAGERAALPPLKLTMHVFADDPGARFVILDGRRLGEGAMVAEGVVLRDIDRDGVVIEAQGRALRLPRP